MKQDEAVSWAIVNLLKLTAVNAQQNAENSEYIIDLMKTMEDIPYFIHRDRGWNEKQWLEEFQKFEKKWRDNPKVNCLILSEHYEKLIYLVHEEDLEIARNLQEADEYLSEGKKAEIRGMAKKVVEFCEEDDEENIVKN